MQFQFLYLGAMLFSPVEETPQETSSGSVVKWERAVLFEIISVDNRYWVPRKAIAFAFDEASTDNVGKVTELQWT
jgi:hypothetical protein